MRNEMRERAGGGNYHHEGDIAPGPETSRERCAERQKPRQIKADMHEIGVDKSVTEEGPEIGAEPARERAANQKIGVIARGINAKVSRNC